MSERVSELKPCPFCGSENIEVIFNDGYEVGCKECSTYIAPFIGNDSGNKQKHIDFWNSRPTADLEPLHVDKLANFIRTIDGNHTKGAGEIAEAIVKHFAAKRALGIDEINKIIQERMQESNFGLANDIYEAIHFGAAQSVKESNPTGEAVQIAKAIDGIIADRYEETVGLAYKTMIEELQALRNYILSKHISK